MDPFTGALQALAQATNGIRWLLRDDFTDTRAAGAVNGTQATPIGGTRSVLDTSGGLSIGGGMLLGTGSATAYDPTLSYTQSFARQAGRCLIGRVGVANASAITGLGFGGSSLTLASNSAFDSARIIDNGFTPTAMSFSAGTYYTVAILLRAAGAFYFIKGGTFTNWTLVYIGRRATATPLYVNFSTRYAYAGQNADFIRVPQALIPAPGPLAADSFNRANGALGTTDGAALTEVGGDGLTWTGSTWTVSGNQAKNTPTVGGNLVGNVAFTDGTYWTLGAGWSIGGGIASHVAGTAGAVYQTVSAVGWWYRVTFGVKNLTAGYVSPRLNNALAYLSNGSYIAVGRASGINMGIDATAAFVGSVDNVLVYQMTLASMIASVVSSSANVLAECALTIAAPGVPTGMILNLDSAVTPSNFVLAYHDGYYATLEKCVNGAYTTLVRAAATYAAGARLVVTKDGTKYRLFYNDTLIGAEQTISDAGIINNTRHGLFSGDANNTLDSFAIWSRGSAGEYNPKFDRYIV